MSKRYIIEYTNFKKDYGSYNLITRRKDDIIFYLCPIDIFNKVNSSNYIGLTLEQQSVSYKTNPLDSEEGNLINEMIDEQMKIDRENKINDIIYD